MHVKIIPGWRSTSTILFTGGTGYNIGGIFDLSENHHILFSAGSDIAGNNRFSAYLGYQWTFEPPEEGKK